MKARLFAAVVLAVLFFTLPLTLPGFRRIHFSSPMKQSR